MISPGDVVPYLEMCREESASLQRGMNFHLRGGLSVILMSLRRGAPYADHVEEGGEVLIYEGHDIPHLKDGPRPKTADQPLKTPAGRPTQNAFFYEAALRYKLGEGPAEKVRVYEKIRTGVWVYNGLFELVDAWQEESSGRKVFKFKLQVAAEQSASEVHLEPAVPHNRLIPTAVKLAVWKRDKGRCVICGSTENLHFDHDIPYSKGGSSAVPENIQILCARHNLAKRDKIE